MAAQQSIRVGARALIFKEGCVLLVKFEDETGLHYNYPGGGVKIGESVRTAVVREVFEETSVRVRVNRLCHVYEYLPQEYAGEYGEIQKLSLLFSCSLLPGEQAHMPENPDEAQIGVEWVPLSRLKEVTVYPKIAEVVIAVHDGDGRGEVFLEDVL